MDHNIDEFQSDTDNQNSLMSSTRRTPGKFNETNAITNYEEDNKNEANASMSNFLYYPTNIDTNAIWKTNKDIHRSFSMPNDSNDQTNDGQDILSSIWKTKKDYSIGIPPNSVSVSSNYESGDYINQNSRVNNVNGNSHLEDEKTKLLNDDENRKIVSIVNSHDGWGKKPVNQKTPWEIPEVSVHNNADGYPDTFSSWLNDNVCQTPNGASAWETYDNNNNTKPSGNGNMVVGNNNFVNGAPNVPQVMNVNKSSWSMMSNDASSWSQMSSNLHTPNCITKPMTNGFKITDHTPESPLTSNNFNPSNRMMLNRMGTDQLKKNMWLNEYQHGNIMPNCDNTGGVFGQRSRKLEIDLKRYKIYKETHRKLTEECTMEQQRLMEFERNITSINNLSNHNLNSRNALSDLMHQRELLVQNINSLRCQIEGINLKIVPIEDELMRENLTTPNNYNPNNAHSSSMHGHHQQQRQSQPPQNSVFNMDMITNKMGFMRVNSSSGCSGATTPDFRLDVPEFVPGKKWSGSGQNGKENRIPLQAPPISLNSTMPNNFPMSESNNKLYSLPSSSSMQHSSYYWLLIQDLPSHVSIDMIQSFFGQHNTPFVTPMHCNPFARWMMIKFHTPNNCQKAFHLLLGNIGRVSLISDQEAHLRLQELKGVMANFVGHQN